MNTFLAEIEAHDPVLRAYARRMDYQDGEDAYHHTVLLFLDRQPQARQFVPFMKHATKQSFWKIRRDQYRHALLNRDAITGRDSPTQINLLKRWEHGPRTACLRGHPFTEDNIVMIGPRRTCRICKRETDRQSGIRYRARLAARRALTL